MPRTCDCREKRSCSSTSELSSQPAAPSIATKAARPEKQIRGSRSHAIRSDPRRLATPAVSRETIAEMALRIDHDAVGIPVTPSIVPGSSPGCTNR